MFKPSNTSHKELVQLWPIWTTIGFPLLLTALDASPIAPNFFFVMIVVPGLLLLWASLGIWAAILTVRSLGQRSWRRAIICAFLPLVVLSVCFRPIGFIRLCNNAGDIVHFYVRHSSYMRTVRATQPNGQPLLLTFNLGGMIWASRGFVYDESDELLRTTSLQSPGWKLRAKRSELGCGYSAFQVPGPFAFTQHWYMASFAC